ncbi:MAG TPA: DUF308 domain-containing protein [Saprospiraceae bacterium]|nr:DUF308 domain-containing protein [Saprospiraceae bacterium]
MSTNFMKTVTNSVKNWWIPLLIGLLFVGTGIYTFMSPVESYVALSFVFAISFLVSGIMEIVFAIGNKDEMDHWGWALVFGILTLIIGGMLVAQPEMSMLTLPLYVGFLILFRSILAIGTALDLKNYGVLDWGNLMVLGVLGVIFSFIMLFNPPFAGMTIVVWTGLAFLAIGVGSIYLAFKLKKLKNEMS